MIRIVPHTIPFSLIAYAIVMVPAPSVAATRSKIEPDVFPALNLSYVNLTGVSIKFAKRLLGDF